MVYLTLLSRVIIFIAITTIPSVNTIEEIKSLTINNNGHGKYSFEYETSGGTYRREEGGITSGSSGNFLAVRGEYGYIDSGGKLYSLRYIADINGFQPEPSDYNVRYNDRRIL